MADPFTRRADAGSLWKEVVALWPKVFGYSLALTGDRHHAEDLCQEAYLRLFSMKRRVDLSRPLLPLLLTMVRNAALDEGRRSKASSMEEAGVEPVTAREGMDPFRVAALRETRRAVQEALEQLSPLWRSVLFLRDGLGFSYPEIAGVTGRSEDTIRVTLHRARQKIRALLKGCEGQERRVQ